MTTENKITIDGKEYEVDSLSEQQKYFVLQIKLLQEKLNNANIELAQLNAAKNTFLESLSKALKEDTDESQAK
jgi:hypothetical protein